MRKLILFLCFFCPLMGIAEDITYKVQEQNIVCRDTTRVLCIGNSFTHYYETPNMLTEISWSQGHFIIATVSAPGGYTFGRHLIDPRTLGAIENTNAAYDVVFLQNQSQLNALYGRDPIQHKLALQDAETLAERVREYSPNAHLFIEATWANPGSNKGIGDDETFDSYNWKGTTMMAKACNADVSPIGKAFAIVRKNHPEIVLLSNDNHHQSKAGSYLKSCVNYLMIFGDSFSKSTSCCGLDPDVAHILQQAAAEAL